MWRSDSGYPTYIIAAKRMTCRALKWRNGWSFIERSAIALGIEFGLTMPRQVQLKNLRRTFAVIRETLLSYPLWERLPHQEMAPTANTAPPFAVSK
jgi:hypothetical protein